MKKSVHFANSLSFFFAFFLLSSKAKGDFVKISFSSPLSVVYLSLTIKHVILLCCCILCLPPNGALFFLGTFACYFLSLSCLLCCLVTPILARVESPSYYINAVQTWGNNVCICTTYIQCCSIFWVRYLFHFLCEKKTCILLQET